MKMKNSIKSSIWSFITLGIVAIVVMTYNFAPNLVSGENLLVDFGYLAACVIALGMSLRYAILSSNENDDSLPDISIP